MNLIIFLCGAIIGVFLVWFFMKAKWQQGTEIANNEVCKRQDVEIKELKVSLSIKDADIKKLSVDYAVLQSENTSLKEKLNTDKSEIESLQNKFNEKFENITNKMLEHGRQKLISENELIMNPLKEKMDEFKRKIEDVHKEQIGKTIELKTEIKQLVKLNNQVSEDANKLANALKGNSKERGNWGEIQLENILIKAGLRENIHYTQQTGFRDQEDKLRKPDFIIKLPQDKNIIVDSKVSLVDYENYFNYEGDEKEERDALLKRHVASVKNHISELSQKDYKNLMGIRSLDYVLLFIPIENALTVVVNDNHKIYEDALDQNIVLVTTPTLLATLRTIAYIWKQEDQKNNAEEIAKVGGHLYDKFVNFFDDLQAIGKKLNEAQESYSGAMNKLKTSPKKGDTIIGRIQQLKDLGAKADKSLPTELVDNNRLD